MNLEMMSVSDSAFLFTELIRTPYSAHMKDFYQLSCRKRGVSFLYERVILLFFIRGLASTEDIKQKYQNIRYLSFVSNEQCYSRNINYGCGFLCSNYA